jgi:hypothetical protein
MNVSAENTIARTTDTGIGCWINDPSMDDSRDVLRSGPRDFLLAPCRLLPEAAKTSRPSMIRILVHALLWAIASSALIAAAITAVLVWRSEPEFHLGAHEVGTWFGIVWALAFVPCFAVAAGVRHLLLEIGDQDGNRRPTPRHVPTDREP